MRYCTTISSSNNNSCIGLLMILTAGMLCLVWHLLNFTFLKLIVIVDTSISSIFASLLFYFRSSVTHIIINGKAMHLQVLISNCEAKCLVSRPIFNEEMITESLLRKNPTFNQESNLTIIVLLIFSYCKIIIKLLCGNVWDVIKYLKLQHADMIT